MSRKLFWVSTRTSSHTRAHMVSISIKAHRQGQGTVMDEQHTELKSCRDKLYFQGGFSGHWKPAMPPENRLANRYF